MILTQKILHLIQKLKACTRKKCVLKNKFFVLPICIISLCVNIFILNPIFATSTSDQQLFSHNSQADITFSGDRAKKHKNTYELIGNVVLTQDNTTLKSDKAYLYYKQNQTGDMKLDNAVAVGNVTISKYLVAENSELRASCQKVKLFPEKNLLLLTGNAKVWRNDEFIHAQIIKINTITGDLNFNVPRGQFATKKAE